MKYSVIPVAQSLILSCLNFNFYNVVISPGSRNVPLAIGFASNNNFNCYSIVDERSAAFFALGLSQRSKEPTILVCTSGSALLNYYPAIAEAYYSEIPLIILSADRPAYKLNIGDGQTINQNNVFEKNILYSKSLKQDCTHSTEEIIKSNKQEIIDGKSTASSILSKQKSIQNDNELIIEEAFNNCINNNIGTLAGYRPPASGPVRHRGGTKNLPENLSQFSPLEFPKSRIRPACQPGGQLCVEYKAKKISLVCRLCINDAILAVCTYAVEICAYGRLYVRHTDPCVRPSVRSP